MILVTTEYGAGSNKHDPEACHLLRKAVPYELVAALYAEKLEAARK